MIGRNRVGVADSVKGLAIILVVFGHVAQGAEHRGWWSGPSFGEVDAFIYAFHMPAFFFVAGLFFGQSLESRGLRRFLVDKFKTVLYPYLVFLVPGCLAAAIGVEASGRHPLIQYALDATTGRASWFLYSLFLVLVLAALLRKVPVVWKLLGAAALSWLWRDTGAQGLDGAFHEAVFLFAGELVGSRNLVLLARMGRLIAGATALALFSAVFVVTKALGPLQPASPAFVSCGLLGTAGLFMTAQASSRSPVDRWLQWIGVASLSVFLLHPFIQGIAMMALLHTGVGHTLGVELAVPTVLAVILPAVIWHRRKRLRVAWLFALPTQARARPDSNALAVASETA